MKSKWVWALLVAVLRAVLHGGTVQATPPSGVTVTPLAPVAQFGEINAKAKIDDWKAKLKTKGVSDVHVVQVTIQPGGTLGWHQHPGLSFVIVKSGTATFYEGDDRTCTPLRDPDRLEPLRTSRRRAIVRNEGTEPLVNVVVQVVPTGALRLISVPSLGNCPF